MGKQRDSEESMSHIVRKVLLASVGAAALAQEELEEFVNRLVEKGQIAEKDGRKLIKDVLERRKKRTERFGETFDEGMERFLSLLNIPTKSDISELSRLVTELSHQVEDLKKGK